MRILVSICDENNMYDSQLAVIEATYVEYDAQNRMIKIYLSDMKTYVVKNVDRHIYEKSVINELFESGKVDWSKYIAEICL